MQTVSEKIFAVEGRALGACFAGPEGAKANYPQALLLLLFLLSFFGCWWWQRRRGLDTILNSCQCFEDPMEAVTVNTF
jgi:hypothetical protein